MVREGEEVLEEEQADHDMPDDPDAAPSGHNEHEHDMPPAPPPPLDPPSIDLAAVRAECGLENVTDGIGMCTLVR